MKRLLLIGITIFIVFSFSSCIYTGDVTGLITGAVWTGHYSVYPQTTTTNPDTFQVINFTEETISFIYIYVDKSPSTSKISYDNEPTWSNDILDSTVLSYYGNSNGDPYESTPIDMESADFGSAAQGDRIWFKIQNNSGSHYVYGSFDYDINHEWYITVTD